MIDDKIFQKIVEAEVRRTRRFDEAVKSVGNVAASVAAAYCPIFRALKYECPDVQAEQTDPDSRIGAAKAAMFRFSLDTGNPTWSSYLLDRVVDALEATPSSSADDLYTAIFEILTDYAVPLNTVVANLFKDLFRRIPFFTKLYWKRAKLPFDSKHIFEGKAQAYLLFGIMYQADRLTPEIQEKVFEQLSGTEFKQELEDILTRPK